jgi:hypothetical protein
MPKKPILGPPPLPPPGMIFVSPTGKDTNPGTQQLPLLTFEAAIGKLSSDWPGRQHVFLAPGIYKVAKDRLDVVLGHQYGARAEPLIIEGGFADQTGKQAVTAVTATSVSSANLALPPDSLVGSRLRFVDGAAAGSVYLVTGNTKDSFTTLPTVLSPLPALQDHFVVERQSVEIEYPTGLSFTGNGSTQLILTGIRWHPLNPGDSSYFQLAGGMQVYAHGCDWDMNGGFCQVVNQCTLTSGSPLDPLLSGALPPAMACYVHDGFAGLGFRASQSSFVFGAFVTKNIGVNAQGGGGMQLTLIADKCAITVDGTYGSTFLELDGGRVSNAPGNALAAFKDASLTLSQVEISGAGGNAIDLDERAYAEMQGVTGSKNNGHGLSLGSGVRVKADAANQVTGVAGDILLGGATHGWADVATGVSDASTFARIDRGK